MDHDFPPNASETCTFVSHAIYVSGEKVGNALREEALTESPEAGHIWPNFLRVRHRSPNIGYVGGRATNESCSCVYSRERRSTSRYRDFTPLNGGV